MAGTKTKLDIGGDYDQWWKGTRSALKGIPDPNRRGLLVYCEPQRKGRLRHDIQENAEEGNAEASVIILGRVSPSLLLRVPFEDRFLPRKLLAHLAVFSKPFRILNLPYELRLRIYEMYFASVAPGDHFVLHGYYGNAYTFELPSLTKTSRQIREESLKLFISSKTLQIDLPYSKHEPQAVHNMETIRLWAEKCATAYVRHIRSVELFSFYYGDFRCILSFTDHNGLKIHLENDRPRDYDDAKAEAKRKQLQEHAEKIEAERRALDLKGESIILAMIIDPKVWFWEDDEDK